MREIRLCWVSTINSGPFREPLEFGVWCPDDETSRSEIEHIVDTGNQVWGEGSHWIQERELSTLQGLTTKLLLI